MIDVNSNESQEKIEDAANATAPTLNHGQGSRNQTQFRTFDPTKSTMKDVNSVVDARKMRLYKENEVRKLHNRISLL